MIKSLTVLSFYLMAVSLTVYALQPDTLRIKQINSPPVMDGIADNDVWGAQSWISIDQVWKPFPGHVSETDFSGRYQVLWSPTTNLLYFLVEITDDVFREGYVYNSKDATYEDYDILEIFIDPDQSGGLHVFDGECADAMNRGCWGTNAENAFTYHINVNAPKDSHTTYYKTVQDISGKSWSNKYIRNYADHLPDFAFRKVGNVFTYEFSLKVFKDSFDPKKPSEADRDSLFAGKIMGMSVAYCDSDTKTGKARRESFIGSIKADNNALDSNGGFNQAWMNATYFGVVLLTNKN